MKYNILKNGGGGGVTFPDIDIDIENTPTRKDITVLHKKTLENFSESDTVNI